MTDISAIYVRLPNWIGDVCMALPSLHALLDTGKPVIVCARPWAKALLSGYALAGFIEMTGSWTQNRRAVAQSRRQYAGQGATVGLLLPDSLSSAMVFRLAGLQCAGYRDDGRSLLLKWPVRKPQPRPHAVESWYGLTQTALTLWNLPCPAGKPSDTLGLKLRASANAQVLSVLSRAGLDNTPFILIAPTATGLHKGQVKVWPHFNALTLRLQQQGYTVVMCPPPGERDDALRNAPAALCLDPLPLDDFVALTQKARLVICNDSGVSHLSAAGNALQLTLFGVTDRERTGPWSPKAHCLGQMGQWPELDNVAEKAISLAGK
ncbi:glycosyltransferase family 9 protein [Pusillimonas minor]|uniref:Heptosyltransferase n=1 Tax=Pusillimonas minor TaxID=2697024 RepID=A0A842HTX1_9BURK|nr:glycosyltransferase family 9 protein [Pusillimonas minor]MBC2770860.1 heptosyltransferase [Pusillimonas minor]